MTVIALGLLIALVLLYLVSSIKIVRQGYQYTIEHFGRYTTTAAPGFNFYPALFYRVGRRVNMMEQVIDIPGQEKLEDEILAHGATCILVSHDRSFVRGLGNRFLLIDGRRLKEVDSPEGFFETMAAEQS